MFIYHIAHKYYRIIASKIYRFNIPIQIHFDYHFLTNPINGAYLREREKKINCGQKSGESSSWAKWFTTQEINTRVGVEIINYIYSYSNVNVIIWFSQFQDYAPRIFCMTLYFIEYFQDLIFYFHSHIINQCMSNLSRWHITIT